MALCGASPSGIASLPDCFFRIASRWENVRGLDPKTPPEGYYPSDALPRFARLKGAFRQSVNSAYVAPIRPSSASGASSTCAPTFPALTQIVSKSCAVSSMNVGYAFFMPTGLHPP